MSWWVGSYIEAAAAAGGSSGTAYLPFVFQAASKADAQKGAGAKLLSGPYSTQAAAQAWATAYEKNPKTTHAGSDIPAGPGQPVKGSGSGPGGTGTEQGDQAPAGASGLLTGLNAIGDFFSRLTQANTWIRLAKVVAGGVLLLAGIAHMSGAQGTIYDTARKLPA